MAIDDVGVTRWCKTAVCLAALALTAGCGVVGSERSEAYIGSAPIVSGNTFDRYNELAVVPPVSENLSISYQFELHSDPRGDTVADVPGPVWFYAERSAAVPAAFLQVALLPGAPPTAAALTETSEEPAGPVAETVRLGRLDYVSRMQCVDTAQVDGVSAAVAALIRNVGSRGYGLSKDVFVRSFESEKPGLDGKRVALVYTRDVTRLGYDCDTLGDLFVPNAGLEETVDLLREEAARSFEVIQ